MFPFTSYISEQSTQSRAGGFRILDRSIFQIILPLLIALYFLVLVDYLLEVFLKNNENEGKLGGE